MHAVYPIQREMDVDVLLLSLLDEATVVNALVDLLKVDFVGRRLAVLSVPRILKDDDIVPGSEVNQLTQLGATMWSQTSHTQLRGPRP